MRERWTNFHAMRGAELGLPYLHLNGFDFWQPVKYSQHILYRGYKGWEDGSNSRKSLLNHVIDIIKS